MKWFIIENFVENNDKHLELLEGLCHGKICLLVRKEYIDFEDLDEEQKRVLIDDDYALFKEGLLYIKTEEINRIIENKLLEISKKILLKPSCYNKDNILKMLEQDRYCGYLNELKNLITDELVKNERKEELLGPDKFVYKVEKNQSHKFYSSEGMLENESDYFNWYQLSNVEELKRFIEENNCNYNIIMGSENKFNEQYSYYVNFYEGDKFILAVRDNIGDFCNIFKGIFKNKYKIVSDEPDIL